jgi:hypothetical protein
MSLGKPTSRKSHCPGLQPIYKGFTDKVTLVYSPIWCSFTQNLFFYWPLQQGGNAYGRLFDFTLLSSQLENIDMKNKQ